jgi:histidine ammonia-lyase
MATLTLKPGSISLSDLRRISRGDDAVALTDGWRRPVEAALAAVRARLAAGESLYGINTGFGKLAKTRISDDELAKLQLYLMRSHAAGIGPVKAAVVARRRHSSRIHTLRKLTGLAWSWSMSGSFGSCLS